jgi:hypothetical protein
VPTDPPAPTDAQADVLRRALTAIVDDPRAWDQGTFGVRRSCGTAFCVAGHVTVTVLGYVPTWYEDRWLSTVHVPGRGNLDPAWAAAAALGLVDADGDPDDRADALFAGGRSLRRLVELAAWYTGGRVDLLTAYDDLAARCPDVAAADRAREAAEARELTALVTFLSDRAGRPADRAGWEDHLG